MMVMPSTVDVSFGLPYRYLIFFDDGYAQYSNAADIHKVLAQSKSFFFFIVCKS